MQTTQQALIWKKALELSPLLSVSKTLLYYLALTIAKRLSELELDEEGTRISLTIVDTPGFGDQIDNEARLVNLEVVI